MPKKHPNSMPRRPHHRTPPLLESLESRLLLTTYYVSPAGNDGSAGGQAAPFKTLQNAVSHLNAGDTLNVEAGTYAGFIVGWDPANSGPYSVIAGTASSPIIIQADPSATPGSVIVNSCNNKSTSAIDLEPGCNYITLNGFTITNGGTLVGEGIKVAGSSNVNITNFTVHGVGETGIFTSFATNGTIANNLSYSNGEHGIYASNSPQNETIINNISHDNPSAGIQVNADASQGGPGTAAGLLIAGNIIYNNGASGGAAFNLDGVQSSTIQNNLLFNNHGGGIVLFDGDAAAGSMNNVVVNNTVVQASGAHPALDAKTGSSGNIIFNNIFLGNMEIDSTSTPAAFSHNLLLTGFINDGTYTYTGSTTTTASALFTNGSGQLNLPSDYTLKSGSPAVDAGLATLNGKSAPATDLAGNARPNGSAWDIGTYERITDTTPPTFSNVLATPISSTSVTITWTTNESSDSQVVWGTASSYGNTSTLNTTLVTSHSVTLTGMTPNTIYHYAVKSRDASGNLGTSGDFTTSPLTPAVVGRWVSYKASSWFDTTDDNAIATDKSALLPGGVATFANYTSYSRGINGIMVDIAAPAGTLNASDFLFSIGNNSQPSGWTAPPAPTLLIRTGAGVNGSTRIEFTWADNVIQNTWLQVTVRADTNTGLAAANVFYFGNAIGDTGNSLTNAQVTAVDEIGARYNAADLRGLPVSTAVANVYDFNRDGQVNSADEAVAGGHYTNFLNALNLIATPVASVIPAVDPVPPTPATVAGTPAIGAPLHGLDLPTPPVVVLAIAGKSLKHNSISAALMRRTMYHFHTGGFKGIRWRPGNSLDEFQT